MKEEFLLDYNKYIKYMENLNWKRFHTFLNIKNKDYVFINGVRIPTTKIYGDVSNEEKKVVYIVCPENQMISIYGTFGRYNDYKEAHTLKVKFFDTSNNEISRFTKIRITKEEENKDMHTLSRVFYDDINFKDKEKCYRFLWSFELISKNHFGLYIVPDKVDKILNKEHTKLDFSRIGFELECDIWKKHE